MTPEVSFCVCDGADPTVDLPSYASAGAAGADIRANLAPEDRQGGVWLEPGQRLLVPTGFMMALPSGFEAQIRPRSGLALKDGVTVANAPGTIDSDYRGPVGVILINLGTQRFHIIHGQRIAQMVIAAVTRARFQVAKSLDNTARGTGGFGSTGRH